MPLTTCPELYPPLSGGNAAAFQLLQEAVQQLLPDGSLGSHTATELPKVPPHAGSLLAGGRCQVCGGCAATTHGSGGTAGNVWAKEPGSRGAAVTPWWDSTGKKASSGLTEVGRKESAGYAYTPQFVSFWHAGLDSANAYVITSECRRSPVLPAQRSRRCRRRSDRWQTAKPLWPKVAH